MRRRVATARSYSGSGLLGATPTLAPLITPVAAEKFPRLSRALDFIGAG